MTIQGRSAKDQRSFHHSWFILSQVIIQVLKLPDVRYLGCLWLDFHYSKASDQRSICDQTSVGPCSDLLGLFIGDPYEITGFGILKIQPQMAKISDIR